MPQKEKRTAEPFAKKNPAVFVWEKPSSGISPYHDYFSVAAFVPAVRPKTITSAMALPPKRLEP